MYAAFLGLAHAPFSIAPDPRYLFMSERHREALAHLLYGLDAGGGFVLLTGEIGTGKTTVCRCFLEQIPAHCNVAYIFNPKLTVPELLRSICDEFGVAHRPAVPGAETVKDCLDPLNEFLLQQHAAGRNNVLIIDEAQNLAPDVLEQLRLLTNLETSERKLLQIILIGQPELRAMLARPELEQLAQRVIARYHLQALGPEETRQYIAHRLAVAGLQGPPPFQRRALARVHALAGGVPRRINLLCDRALLGAYAAGVREVSDAMVRKAAREVFDANAAGPRPAGARARWWAAGAGGLLGAAAVAGLGWSMGWWPQPAAVAERAAAQAPAPQASAAPVAAAAASGASAPQAAASAPAEPLTLARFLSAQPAADTAPAWQLLAQAWQASLPADVADPCAVLAPEGLRCWRSRRASLNLLRLLDRPALLTLQPSDAQQGARGAVLRRLDGAMATLQGVDGATLQVPVVELAPLWHGEIATLWKAPANLPAGDDVAATAAGAAWLDRQLALAGAAPAGSRGVSPEVRRARVHQFQLGQGLTPDGQAGPLTLMLLNRAAGVQEPRLRGGA
ncbi:ATPase AAA [Alicycliphilus denitrificans]|uniref:AAA family ATPase n=1 Tax=Alicycliphilus denitrificans TaxID=179636 RepID=UPI00095F0C24|nr:AAA family ATPase [Alicycliphilus denitrificans]MBN9572659.1 AAA family ATPase [Alicycliphilus denitrificans]OJW92638.1 MAG: peptidoglycan-binding protein [Alicycliphilus sp. 69-12]BCN37246.1 ATPase AAA [Alicycliphilus denitrificans]